MKVAVTGASGFIGSNLVNGLRELESSIEVRPLFSMKRTDGNYSLSDFDSLCKSFSGVDVVVHTAFDHAYRENKIGITNILKACYECSVKRLIYMSSFVVYDPLTHSSITENTELSKFCDPYTQEKLAIERIISDFKPSFEVVILQPSIVIGVGGAWSKQALSLIHHDIIRLPSRGEAVCNILYIDDLVDAIRSTIKCSLDSSLTKLLVSSSSPCTWREFYEEHLKLVNVDLSKIEFENTNGRFHDNKVINTVFVLWYQSVLGRFVNVFTGAIKRIRRKFLESSQLAEDLENPSPKVANRIFSPIGITRLFHASSYKVDTNLSTKVIQFSPKYNLQQSMKRMQKLL